MKRLLLPFFRTWIDVWRCPKLPDAQAKKGGPCQYQRLIYAGKQLKDEDSMADCSLESGSTVHLVLRLRGGKGGFGALLRGAGDALPVLLPGACPCFQYSLVMTECAYWLG